MSNKTANGSTTKTRKSPAAVGRKRVRSASVKANAGSAAEPPTGTAGSKRKKAFVL